MDNVFLKNPIILLLDRLGISLFQFPVAKFAKARIAERLSKLNNGENVTATQKPDLLSKFLKAQQDRPEIMTDRRVLTMAVSMTFAGSETTAISLSAVFYYLLKNPSWTPALRRHSGCILPLACHLKDLLHLKESK